MLVGKKVSQETSESGNKRVEKHESKEIQNKNSETIMIHFQQVREAIFEHKKHINSKYKYINKDKNEKSMKRKYIDKKYANIQIENM